jgi:hypothetical protein
MLGVQYREAEGHILLNALADKDNPIVEYELSLIGREPLPLEEWEYIGSVDIRGGFQTLHVFLSKEPEVDGASGPLTMGG